MNAEAIDNLCMRLLYTYVMKRSVSLNTFMGRYVFSAKPVCFPKNILIDFRNKIRIKYFFEMCLKNNQKFNSVTPK